MQTENLMSMEPEFKIDEHFLKIKYPEGHKNYSEGKEFVFYSEKLRDPGDVKGEHLLRRLDEALDNAWRKQNEKDILSKKIELSGLAPDQDEAEVLKMLNKGMTQDLARPLAAMNPAYDTRIEGVRPGTTFSDQLSVLGPDWAFSPEFAYGGLNDVRNGFEYVLFLDDNLDFDYQEGYGLKYRRIVR